MTSPNMNLRFPTELKLRVNQKLASHVLPRKEQAKPDIVHHLSSGGLMGPGGPMRPEGSKGPRGPMGPNGSMGAGGPMGPNGPMKGPGGPRGTGLFYFCNKRKETINQNGHVMGSNGPMMGLGPRGMGPNGPMMGLGPRGMGPNGPMMGHGSQGMGPNGSMMGHGSQGMRSNGPMMRHGSQGMGPNGPMMGPGGPMGVAVSSKSHSAVRGGEEGFHDKGDTIAKRGWPSGNNDWNRCVAETSFGMSSADTSLAGNLQNVTSRKRPADNSEADVGKRMLSLKRSTGGEEENVEDSLFVDPIHQAHFLDNGGQVVQDIGLQFSGVVISFQRSGASSDRVILEGPRKSVDGVKARMEAVVKGLENQLQPSTPFSNSRGGYGDSSRLERSTSNSSAVPASTQQLHNQRQQQQTPYSRQQSSLQETPNATNATNGPPSTTPIPSPTTTPRPAHSATPIQADPGLKAEVRLYNIRDTATERMIRSHFGTHGTIIAVSFPKKKNGSCHVLFSTEEEAQACIENFDKTEYKRRTLQVTSARVKQCLREEDAEGYTYCQANNICLNFNTHNKGCTVQGCQRRHICRWCHELDETEECHPSRFNCPQKTESFVNTPVPEEATE